MKSNLLKTSSHKKSRRVGRGISAGRGKTAGRGTKGQNSRAGSRRRFGFEGGQNPLIQRLPKLRGFKSHHRAYYAIYTQQLNGVKPTEINNQTLIEAGLLPEKSTNAKLIVKGKLTSKKNIRLQAASKEAIKLIEAAGGSFVKTPAMVAKAKPKPDAEAK